MLLYKQNGDKCGATTCCYNLLYKCESFLSQWLLLSSSESPDIIIQILNKYQTCWILWSSDESVSRSGGFRLDLYTLTLSDNQC